jgi:hypothetical protein
MAHSKMAPKRKVNVRGQPHSLAYINKDEARMLRRMGGSGKPGPSGVPTYFPNTMDPGEAAEGGFTDSFDGSYSGGNDGGDDGGNQRVIQQPVAPKAAPKQSERQKALSEVNARIDRLSAYSEKKDTNFINKYAAKANVAGASRVANKLGEEGAIAIRNKAGEVVGAMHQGRFGMVYSGRMLDKADYTGPAEFANNVTMDGGNDSDGPNIRGGATKKETIESIDGKVNLPDAPSSGEGGDATDDAKKRSKMGKESTISTTGQGLLGAAKTRNRSLMSGLIS